MSAHCPHLRLVEARDDALAEPSAEHRCFARIPSERVGLGFQARTCLTAEYRRCPRAYSAEYAPAPRLVVPEPPPSRRWSATEVVVAGMGVAIALAMVFVGVAFAFRLVRGPGMTAALPVVVEDMPATAGAQPAGADTPTVPAPTLLPALAATLVAPIMSPTPDQGPATPLETPVREPATEPPTRLVIAGIGLDITVQAVGVKTIREGGQPKLVWDDVPNAGAFHQTSALPGNVGNTVINGHRDIKGAVFRHLDRVKVGDEIVVYVGDVAFPYTVSETLVVPEVFASAEQQVENMRLIGYLPEERLTLVTCTPIGLATHRLLVIAKPQAMAGPQMPDAGSNTTP